SAFCCGSRKLRAYPSLTVTSSPIWPMRPTRSSRMTFICFLSGAVLPGPWARVAVRNPGPSGTPTANRRAVAAPAAWSSSRRRGGAHALLHCVGHDADEARPLDRPCQFTLLLGRHRGDAARHDLAALRNVALQQPHVLVVDGRRIGAGERAGLAPTLERAPRLGGGEVLDGHDRGP